ncbi:MAG: hypothetical protein KatS3mg118_0284 [Paracoccaceae bacterium]|nr:MAG: hypothetical protein KatS3mg118_0284 [Paracoccaceae bacterium]
MSRVSEIVDCLASEDIACIRELARGENRRRIPSPHAEKLLAMGLASLEMGHLDLTRSGRRVARMVQE